ncbi:uncharacterized protein K452DRAFT_350018 [Aplosporella prunicola CBS 121167]|uniref:Zn(2)-C6 fungal-type domain-containing protein n=1 Tax=Aplosporella prunicola CBS 121167 TaxID=1176127 RepID=A0A6A6BM18_9PEZI|nr:uncharacterized protein K452DRAFT_350018 [Aplosporella prunicola CBS 121167]KAF2144335.1 hypothetical protein K452DRAFT_350018 [Aplosporella prunicola CBS 121167]
MEILTLPRSRTFTGCGTCRSRHFKCDEARPVCNTCRRLKLPCQGYAARLHWIADEKSAQGSNSFTIHRHALFNGTRNYTPSKPFQYATVTDLSAEDDRRLMSLELSESTGGKPAMDMVLELDAKCERRDKDQEGDNESITAGPFSVFRAYSTRTQPSESPEEVESAEGVDNVINEVTNDSWDAQLEQIVAEQLPSPPIDSSHDDLNLTQQEDQLPIWDTLSGENYDVDSLFPNLSSDLAFPHMDTLDTAAIGNTSNESPNTLSRDFAITQTYLTPVGRPFEQSLSPDIPVLLRYCKSNFAMSPPRLGRRLSPWQRLFVPYVMETFGELTLGDNTSCPRLAIFYAVLANSAFHLQYFSPSQNHEPYWLENGIKYQKMAKEYLKKALQTEYVGNSQVKYKELLMAILAMAISSVFNEPQNIRIFLHDAELLILRRGVPKQKKSFKVRLLHHMYTHLRIIAESTAISSRQESQHSQSEADLTAVSRTFRLPEESLNANLDPSSEKTMELGYNDIHLKVQGRWTKTMYTDIYGIPESLMTLLSQTICLANEKKRLEGLAATNAQISAALMRHTSTLEQNIWSWSVSGAMDRAGTEYANTPESVGIDQNAVKYMALALHQSLLIYFYRRVYNVNAMILQDFVRKTLDYLLVCAIQGAGDQDFAATISWSGFIAACEAVTPELQEKALQCLSMFNKRSIFFASGEIVRIAQEVWKHRKECGDRNISWMDMMSDKM